MNPHGEIGFDWPRGDGRYPFDAHRIAETNDNMNHHMWKDGNRTLCNLTAYAIRYIYNLESRLSEPVTCLICAARGTYPL